MGKGENKIEKALENIKGGFNPDDDQMNQLKDMAEAYSGKSQDDVFVEIIELNKKLSEDIGAEEFQNKMKQIESIRPMLNEEQSKKLDQVLEALKKIAIINRKARKRYANGYTSKYWHVNREDKTFKNKSFVV